MFAILIIGCAVLGLIVGSFLNVVIYRVPRNESIVSPPSACPRCATLIAVRDNVPVLSRLALRGKCRQCHAPIDVRYPVVEFVTAHRIFPVFSLIFSGVKGLCASSREVFLRLYVRATRPRLWHADGKDATSRAGNFYCDVERRLVKYNYGRKIVVAKKSPSIAIKFNLGHRAVFDARL